MQMMIDISEEDYQNYVSHAKLIMDESSFITDAYRRLLSAVINGTPLPKGHGRLLDEKDIIPLYHCTSEIYCDHRNCSDCQYHNVAEYEVDALRTMLKADNE